MNILGYLKAGIAGIGAVTVPPFIDWVVSLLSKALALTFVGPLPTNVADAISLFLTFTITGGAVAVIPNKPTATVANMAPMQATGGKP